MPKATKNIQGFVGGEINKLDPRDISDEALSKAQDVMLDKPGLVRLMGKNKTLLLDSTEEALDANVTPGYGLYSFRADKHIRLKGDITSMATYTYSGSAYTKITSSSEHKFATGSSGAGAYIYIYGASLSTDAQKTNILKRHKILTVIDENNFVIDLLWSDGGVDAAAKWVWNPGWGIRPYVDSNGNYTNEGQRDQSITEDFTYCTEDDNPVDSQPIDGTFIYIVLQDEHVFNIYHYNYDVLITSPVTLTNKITTSFDQDATCELVKPNMVYASNALRISDAHTETNSKNNIVKWFGYTPPKSIFVKFLSTEEERGVQASGIKTKGDWNVFNGTKDDVPGELGSTKGYVESSLKSPIDATPGDPATFSDYGTLQFQVSQFKTRDGSDSTATGGLSSFLNGTNNPGTSDTDLAHNPASDLETGNKAALNIQDPDPLTTRTVFPDAARKIHMVVCGDVQQSGDWQGDNEHAKLKFGMAWVYGTKTMFQESKIFRNDLVEIKSTNSPQNTSGADAPAFSANMTFRFEFFVNNGGEEADSENNAWINPIKKNSDVYDWGDPRLIGASIYVISDGDGDIDDPLYLGTLYIDSNEGFIDSFGNKFSWRSSWHSGNNHSYIGTNGGFGDLWDGTDDQEDHYGGGSATDDTLAIGCALRRVPTLTYRLRNFGLEPYANNEGQEVRWKTSVFAQNRLFVGNVELLDGPDKNVKYPDRMMVSPEMKFDVFPHDTYIDVQTNDGDAIVKLEYYKGKLLQFKKNVLYVIDISGEIYFNEATHMYVGIKNDWSSTVTPGGVVWCNTSGLFVYDGKQIVNLIDNKIDDQVWYNFNQGSEALTSPLVSYVPKHKQIIVCRSPESTANTGDPGDVWIYDVNTESFTFGRKRLSSHEKSNFASSFNDKSLYGVSGSAYNENPEVVQTTAGVYPGYAKGGLFFAGGNTGGNSCTFQYYKGDSSWTSFSSGIKFGSNWNSTESTAQALARRLEDVIGATPDTANADLYISKIESGVNAMYIELTSKTSGTAYNSGDGDTNTGYNSFKLTGAGDDWSTTEDKAGTTPDVGTTNSVTGWVTTQHMSGGSAGTAQENTVTINRGGATTSGVNYKMNLKIYERLSDISDGQILKEYNYTYTTDSSDSSDNNLASSIVSTLKGLQDNGSNQGDDNVSALDYVTIGNASSGAFTITSADVDYKFDFNMTVSGKITLEQFNSDSDSCRNLLIHTKDYDFAEPNVRKKIYKLYMTYKANDSGAGGSANLSNVRVYYAVNGGSTFHAMKIKGSTDAAGTASNIPSSTSFSQAELIPNPTNSSDKPNKIYSIKFKICSEPTSGGVGENVDGFELNDISIIHRVKSIK